MVKMAMPNPAIQLTNSHGGMSIEYWALPAASTPSLVTVTACQPNQAATRSRPRRMAVADMVPLIRMVSPVPVATGGPPTGPRPPGTVVPGGTVPGCESNTPGGSSSAGEPQPGVNAP